MENHKIKLTDFSMLSMIGVGNYAKVILVRKKSNDRIYAMKIVKKKQNSVMAVKVSHAYIEK